MTEDTVGEQRQTTKKQKQRTRSNNKCVEQKRATNQVGVLELVKSRNAQKLVGERAQQ